MELRRRSIRDTSSASSSLFFFFTAEGDPQRIHIEAALGLRGRLCLRTPQHPRHPRPLYWLPRLGDLRVGLLRGGKRAVFAPRDVGIALYQRFECR